MVIKKIFKFINKSKKKTLKNKTLVISNKRAQHNQIEREKAEALKKMGQNKRR